MFGEATANCLQRNKTYRNGCQSIVARPYKQFITSPRSKIYNNVSHHSQPITPLTTLQSRQFTQLYSQLLSKFKDKVKAL